MQNVDSIGIFAFSKNLLFYKIITMKLIKLSALFILFVCFYSCTDRPYKIHDIHEGTPTNADSVLYNLHHAADADHSNNQHHLPRVFWR